MKNFDNLSLPDFDNNLTLSIVYIFVVEICLKMNPEPSNFIASMRQQLTSLLTFPGTHREQAEKYKIILVGVELSE